RVFVANALIGVHEQTRLDPMIEAMLGFRRLNEASRAVLRAAGQLVGLQGEVSARLEGALDRPLARRAARVPGLATLLGRARAGAGFLRSVEPGRLSHALGTRFVLALRLGDEILPVGEDLGPGEHGAMFPAHLQSFEHPCPRFRALLGEVLAWDRTPD